MLPCFRLVTWLVVLAQLATISAQPMIQVCGGCTLADEERLVNPNYTGLLATEGRQLSHGWTLWAEMVNGRGGIDVAGTLMKVNMTIVNTGAVDPLRYRTVYAGFLTGAYGVRCDFLFGPFSSGLTGVAANVVEAAADKRVMFAMHAAAEEIWKCPATLPPPCTQAGDRRFDWTYGGAPTASTFFRPAVDLLRTKQPKSLATFYATTDYTVSVAGGAVTAAQANGIPVVGQIAHARTTDPAVYDDVVRQLRELDPDIVAGGTYYDTCVPFVEALRRNNWLPKALVLSLCLSNPQFVNATRDMGIYMMDFLTWSERVKGPEFVETNSTFFAYFPQQVDSQGLVVRSSPQLFADAYTQRWGEPPVDPLANGAVIDGYLLEYAVRKAGTLDSYAVQAVLPLIYETTFYGLLVFDFYHKNDKKSTLVIQMNDQLDNKILYPISATEMDIVYPLPQWDDRVYTGDWYQGYGAAAEIAVTVVTAVNIVHCLLWMFYTWRHRDHPVFRAAQYLFLITFLFGCIVLLSAIFSWQVYVSSAGCQAFPWLAGVGFTLLIGSIIARGARLYAILRATREFKRVEIKESVVFAGLLLLTAVTVVIMIVWQAAFPLERQWRNNTPIKAATRYPICYSDSGSTALAIVLLVWCSLLVMLAIVIGWLNRHFQKTLFNESKPLAFAAYNLAVFGILTVVLQAAQVTDDTQGLFIIRSVLINVGVFFTVCFLFWTKVNFIRKGVTYDHTSEMKTSSYSQSVGEGARAMTVSIPLGTKGTCPNCAVSLINSQ